MKKVFLFFCLLVSIFALPMHAQTPGTWKQVRKSVPPATCTVAPCPIPAATQITGSLPYGATAYVNPALLASSQQPVWWNEVDGLIEGFNEFEAKCTSTEWGCAGFGYKDCPLPLISCVTGDNGVAPCNTVSTCLGGSANDGWILLNAGGNTQVNNNATVVGSGVCQPGNSCSIPPQPTVAACPSPLAGNCVTITLLNVSSRYVPQACTIGLSFANQLIQGCLFSVTNLTGTAGTVFNYPNGVGVTCATATGASGYITSGGSATTTEPLCESILYQTSGSTGTATVSSGSAVILMGPSGGIYQPIRRHTESMAYDTRRNVFWQATGEADTEIIPCTPTTLSGVNTCGAGSGYSETGILNPHTATLDLGYWSETTQPGATCNPNQKCWTWNELAGMSSGGFASSASSPIFPATPSPSSNQAWGLPFTTSNGSSGGIKFPYTFYEPVNDVYGLFGGQWNSSQVKELTLFYPPRTPFGLSASGPHDPCTRGTMGCWWGVAPTAQWPGIRWAQGDSRMPALGDGTVFLHAGEDGINPCGLCYNDSWILNLNTTSPFFTQVGPTGSLVTAASPSTPSSGDVTLTLSSPCSSSAAFVAGQVVSVSNISPNGYNNTAATIISCSGSSLVYANSTTTAYSSGGYVGCAFACPTSGAAVFPPPNLDPIMDYDPNLPGGKGGIVMVDNASPNANTWFFLPAGATGITCVGGGNPPCWEGPLPYTGGPCLTITNGSCSTPNYSATGAIDPVTNQLVIFRKNVSTSYSDIWYLSLPTTNVIKTFPLGIQAIESPGGCTTNCVTPAIAPGTSRPSTTPVTVGVPLAASLNIPCDTNCSGTPLGYNASSSALSLVNCSTLAVEPAQIRVEGLWPPSNGNAVEWALFDFQDGLAQGTLDNTYCVAQMNTGTGGTVGSPMGGTCTGAGSGGGNAICRASGDLYISTGSATFDMRPGDDRTFEAVTVGSTPIVTSARTPITNDGLNLFGPADSLVPPASTVVGDTDCNPGPPSFTNPFGYIGANTCINPFLSSNSSSSTLTFLDNGPFRTVVDAKGDFVDSATHQYTHWERIYTFWANHTDVKVEDSPRNADLSTTGNDFPSSYKGFASLESRITPDQLASGTRAITFGGVGTASTSTSLTAGGSDFASLVDGYSANLEWDDFTNQKNCGAPGTTPDTCDVSLPMRYPNFYANTSYPLYTVIVDSNGNYQQVTTAGTSGASAPSTWGSTLGATTNNGSGSLQFTMRGTPANPVNGIAYAQDGYQINSTERTFNNFVATVDACITNCIGVTQSGTPTGACSNYATNFSAAQFNNSSNWSSTFSATKLSPGITAVLCGTVTSALNTQALAFQGNGTSGNTIKLLFDTNAVLQSPAFPTTGGIYAGRNYIVIDGGANGVIQNTANGTGLANQQSSFAIVADGGSNIEVKNLTCQNIYVRSQFDPSPIDVNSVSCYKQNASSSGGINIHDNTMHDVGWAIILEEGMGTGLTVANNNIYNADHGLALAPNCTGCTANTVSVHDNHIHDPANWDDDPPANGNHHDGIHLFAQDNGCHWHTTTAETLGYQFVDFNGYIEQVTTAGTTSGTSSGNPCGMPNFSGATQVDGSVTWTKGAFETPGGGIDGEGGTVNGFTVYNNLFDGVWGNNFTANIYCQSGANQGTPPPLSGLFENVSIYNNLFLMPNATVSGNGLLTCDGMTQGVNTVVNNTFVGNSSRSGLYCAQLNDDVNFTFQNNLMVNCQPGLYVYSSGNYGGPPSFSAMDHNGYENVSSWEWGAPTSPQSSFGAWQSACQAYFSGCDATGSFSQSAVDINTAIGLPNQGSSALSVGANLSSFCSTLTALCNDTSAGNTRTPTARPTNWSIGAYQAPVAVSGNHSQYPAGWAQECDVNGNGVQVGMYNFNASPGAKSLEFADGGKEIRIGEFADQTLFLQSPNNFSGPNPNGVQTYLLGWPKYNINTIWYNFFTGGCPTPQQAQNNFITELQAPLLARMPVSVYNAAVNSVTGDPALGYTMADPAQEDYLWKNVPTGIGFVPSVCAVGSCLNDIGGTNAGQGSACSFPSAGINTNCMYNYFSYQWTSGSINQLDLAYSDIQKSLQRGCTPTTPTPPLAPNCNGLSITGSTPGLFQRGFNFYRYQLANGSVPRSDFGGWRSSSVCSSPPCNNIYSKFGYPDKLAARWSYGMDDWEDEGLAEDHLHTEGAINAEFLTGDPWLYQQLESQGYADLLLNMNIAYNNPLYNPGSTGTCGSSVYACRNPFGVNRQAAHWVQNLSREYLFLCSRRDPSVYSGGVCTTSALAGMENAVAYAIMAPVIMDGQPASLTADASEASLQGSSSQSISLGTSGQNPVIGAAVDGVTSSTSADNSQPSPAGNAAPSDGAQHWVAKPYMNAIVEESLFFFNQVERSVRGNHWVGNSVSCGSVTVNGVCVAKDGNNTNVPVLLSDEAVTQSAYGMANWSLQSQTIQNGNTTYSGFIYQFYPSWLNGSGSPTGQGGTLTTGNCYQANGVTDCSHICTSFVSGGCQFGGENYWHFAALADVTGGKVDLNLAQWQTFFELYMGKAGSGALPEWESAQLQMVENAIFTSNPANVNSEASISIPTLVDVPLQSNTGTNATGSPVNKTLTWNQPASLVSLHNSSYRLVVYPYPNSGGTFKNINNWLLFCPNESAAYTETTWNCPTPSGDASHYPSSSGSGGSVNTGWFPISPATNTQWFSSTPYSNSGLQSPSCTAGVCTITYSMAANTNYVFDLKAYTMASVSLTPTAYNFTTQVDGFASSDSPNPFILVNNSGATISSVAAAVSGTNSADFVISSNGCGSSITNGAAPCDINITFTPSIVGAESATLTVSWTGGSITSSLTGTGLAAVVTLVPSNPSTCTGNPFDSTTNGTPSADSPCAFTLNNGTASTLTSVTPSVTGTNSADFAYSIPGSGGCGSTLAPNASCTINDTFTPSIVGAETATLKVTYNGSSNVTSALSGTGTSSGTVALSSAGFGSVTIGNSLTCPLVICPLLQNSTGSTITPGAIGVSGGNFADFTSTTGSGECGATLATGSSCYLYYAFAPSISGSESTTLSVAYTGASGSPVTSTLSGIGQTPPDASLSLTTLTFNVVFGNSQQQTTTLTNTGQATLTVSAMILSDTADYSFSTNPASNCGGSLAYGVSCVVTVTFNPASTGILNGTLSITDNASGSPHVVTLNGTSAAPSIAPTGLVPKAH